MPADLWKNTALFDGSPGYSDKSRIKLNITRNKEYGRFLFMEEIRDLI